MSFLKRTRSWRGIRYVVLALALALTVGLAVLIASVLPHSLGTFTTLLIVVAGLVVAPTITYNIVPTQFINNVEENKTSFVVPYYLYLRCGLDKYGSGFRRPNIYTHLYALVLAPVLQTVAWVVTYRALSGFVERQSTAAYHAVSGFLDRQDIAAAPALGAIALVVPAAIGCAIAARRLADKVETTLRANGRVIDPNYEWRAERTFKRTGPATRSDIYNHEHHSGSYEEKIHHDVKAVWISSDLVAAGVGLAAYGLLAPHDATQLGWTALALTAVIVAGVVERVTHFELR